MVKLYYGNTLSGGSSKIIESIVKNRTEGTHILIVPDRFTLSTESKLMKYIKSTCNIEVLTFERLAARVLEGRTKKCISPEGVTMLLAKTVDKCKDKLICYKNAVASKNFVKELHNAIFNIRNSGISISELTAAASGLKGYAKNKLSDIITLYNGYIAELQQNYTDSVSRLEALTKNIRESEYCASAEFYITDFYTFSGRQYDIIKELMLYAKGVHISVIAGIGGDNRRIYPINVRRRIEAIASECGVNIENVSAFEELTSVKKTIEDNIFGYGDVKTKSDGYLTLYRAASIEEELEYVCCRIIEAVREDKLRYRNIGIVCGDIPSYAPSFDKVFKRYDIPYFWDTRSPLAAEPLSRQILNYIRIIISDYSRSAVIEYAKNMFSGLQNVACFENYCVKYSIDYSRFNSPFALGEQTELDTAEEIRSKLIAMILPLPKSAKVGEYICLIKKFIAHNGYEEKLAALITRQKKEDFKEGAARSAQIFEKLNGIFGELEELMGGEEKTLEQFYLLLESGLESVNIALIPQSADCVYIGETEDSRFEDKRILFIMGASNGKIPFDSTDSGILGDRDYAVWKTAGVDIRPTLKEKNLYGRFYIEQLLVKPSDKLFVGWSALDAKGAKNNPSVIIGQLSYIFGVPIESAENLIGEKTYTFSNAYKKLLDAIRDFRRGATDAEKLILRDTLYRLLPFETQKTVNNMLQNITDSLQTGEGLFLSSGHTSVSELECYFGCPYKHFVRYGLRAKERDKDKIESRETGTVIHDMLEIYFRTLKDIDICDKEIADRVNTIVDKLFEQPRYKSMLESAAAIQLMRLKRECVILATDLTRLRRQSAFVPKGFEVCFGGSGQYPGVKLLGGKIELAGKIDRIDEYNDDVAVIDYKTGKIDADIKNVYYGKKIQLYAYLGALKNVGKKPAAAFYLPLRADFSKAGKETEKYVYRGQLVLEDKLLEAFDTRLKENGCSPIIPVEYSEKKGYNTGRKAKILITRKDMDNIIDYVEKLAEKALVEIKDGYIAPNPVKDECEYCAAKAFCGIDLSISSERLVKAVGLDSFEVESD